MRTRVTAATKPPQFTDFPALYHFKSYSTEFVALMTDETTGMVLHHVRGTDRYLAEHAKSFNLGSNAHGRGYWSKFEGELTLTNDDEFST